MDKRRRRTHPSAPVPSAARDAQADPPPGAAPTASTRWAEPTDAALLQAAQRDPLAFAPLYQRYATPASSEASAILTADRRTLPITA